MPNLNAKEPGDNFYPQYNRITTESVSNIALFKGRLYTKGSGSSGGDHLVAPGSAGFLNGLYQSTRAVPKGEVGDHSVQCFGPGSRIALLTKTANLHPGQLVKYNHSTFAVELFAISSTSVSKAEYAGKIGRIFEIYSKTDIAKKKSVTAVNDIVIVELGQG